MDDNNNNLFGCGSTQQRDIIVRADLAYHMLDGG